MSQPPSSPCILLTGATGKVGQHFLGRFLDDPRFGDWRVRALCNQRTLPETERVSVARGSIEDRAVVATAMQGVTHVLHLATCKETPELVMDVTVKGLFWLLEECRASESFRQFVLIGGDAGMGHFVYPHPIPIIETQRHSGSPVCYALSKVLEEVMLEQYYIQYNLNGCCLRAPWIMEKDDFKYQLSFGKDVFGGPRWRDLVPADRLEQLQATGTVPVMLDPAGEPVRRNFVHVDDLTDAILLALDHPAARQQTFNISMNEPVDYRQLAEYLLASRGIPSIDVKTDYHSTWLDNAKARFLLSWQPKYDLRRMTDEAFDYQRPTDQPRKIWYPG